MDSVTFRIFRFDPENDSSSRYQDYEYELEPGVTLLNSLNTIRSEQDATIAYRMSCGSAICGSCAMRANGHAVLACKTQTSGLVKDGVIQIDPLGNMKVIHDLVVDLEPFWDSLRKVKPYLQPDTTDSPEMEREQTQEQFLLIDDVTTCILCGACFSDCNALEVDENFLGPATLAKAHRFIYDTRDSKTEERLEDISELHGVWDCTHCAECSTRCPTETKPLARIEEIREAAMKAGVHGNNGARHVLGFRETVGKSGRLNENYLPPRSVGFLNIPGLLSLLPVGIRMLMRGKNPPLIHHSIDKVDEVKKIFSKFEEYRK
ncbi:Succinate dehydrogenase iron-sulfur protein [hydrothermal vent metagenome]|uniref:succinate dehydrogenase n=1 Tax=hydrothermal vent metagenome TaxID=652676 RepID=A0A3B1C1G4_9ZZZZ